LKRTKLNVKRPTKGKKGSGGREETRSGQGEKSKGFARNRRAPDVRTVCWLYA